MRGRLLITALFVFALHGCGSGDTNSSSGTPPAQPQPQAAVPAAAARPSVAAAPKPAPKPKATETLHVMAVTPPATRFVPAAKSGRAPAVVFVDDLAAGKDEAMVEASRLAQQGVASLVLAGAYRPTRDAAKFGSYVDQVRGVIADLRKRPDVEPDRIALLGEGTGARVAAVVLGKEHGALRGAVLADLGTAAGGRGTFAPQRWLGRSPGSQVMLQRSADDDRTTDAQIKQLVLAAPPGTLVYEYPRLDAKAQAERDRWLRNVLR